MRPLLRLSRAGRDARAAREGQPDRIVLTFSAASAGTVMGAVAGMGWCVPCVGIARMHVARSEAE
jgi:hypothetical protein